jgi:dTDP-4-amino-4,6-dideoxygalactose transaminase
VNHGQPEKYKHDLVGYNYRMSQLQAASLSVKLKHLDDWTNKRIRAAERYTKNLKGNRKIKLLDIPADNKCVFHLYPIFIRNRDKVIKKLNEAGIQTGIHYPIPIHLQNAYKHLGHKAGSFPVAEEQALKEVSLPIYPELTNSKIDYVSEKLLEYLK